MISFLIALFISLQPPSIFDCDGHTLNATIRNNLNGDFMVVNDLENIDKGAFVTLEWDGINLMLPVSFKVGEISFTDKKWLWSYQDIDNGLRIENPRFAQVLPSGQILEHKCQSAKVSHGID